MSLPRHLTLSSVVLSYIVKTFCLPSFLITTAWSYQPRISSSMMQSAPFYTPGNLHGRRPPTTIILILPQASRCLTSHRYGISLRSCFRVFFERCLGDFLSTELRCLYRPATSFIKNVQIILSKRMKVTPEHQSDQLWSRREKL